MITWPIVKGTATLSATLGSVVYFGDHVVKSTLAMLGEAAPIGRDTPISLEAACIVGGVIVGFSIWINKKFDSSARHAKEASAAATLAATNAATAATNAATASSTATESRRLMTDAIVGLKKQLDTLACLKTSAEIPCELKKDSPATPTNGKLKE